jgi:hypothetical protein
LTLSANTINLSETMNINGGMLYLNSFNGVIEATSMSLTNFGVLLGTADVTVSGALTASNSTAYGPGLLILKGPSTVANFSLSGAYNSQARPIDNYGYVSLVGDLLAGPAQIRNLPGGTIDCMGDHRISATLGTPVAVINSGTLVKSSGAGSFVIDIVVHNNGLLVANAGVIEIDGGLLQTGGETRLDGGGFLGGNNFEMEAGTVTGSGTVNVYQFDNTGATVSPGLTNAPVGSIHFTEEYNQGPGGTLSLYILNPSAAGYSYIAAGAPSTLGGTLVVTLDPGYQPALGDSFQIVQCGQATGQFGNLILPPLGGGLSFKIGYGKTGATLTVVSGQ